MGSDDMLDRSDDMVDRSASIENVSSGELEAEMTAVNSLEVVLSVGDTTREMESVAEVLTRLELDLACSSEKLVNLDILVLHVASRKNDFEAFAFEEDEKAEGQVQKALEFNILYGFLDSEVGELERFLSLIQTEIVSSQETISSVKQLGDAAKEMEDKLHDCEDSLNRRFAQVSDIKVQSTNFRRILLASSGDNQGEDDKEIADLDNGDLPNVSAKMQTTEQQRNILRMLEKSLAREMDLEKKLNESRETEESLKLQMQQEVFCMEVEAEDIWQRLFEAENSAEVLLMISKELLGQRQMAHNSINGSTQRDEELQSKLQQLNEQLKEKACALQGSETSRIELVEKVSLLEQKLRESESQLQLLNDSVEQNKGFKAKATEAEKRAEIAEAECKLLRDSNTKLNKDASLLKSSVADASERLERMEKQLMDSEIKRLHAEASAEASQEKQNMLECTIKDMENLIRDLKLKAVKAEKQTESVEDKCIILSESNAELMDELNFLRHRIQNLENSLHQADESKKGTAKDISETTKMITDLVMQLTLERERLHNQLSSLAKEKKVMYLQQMKSPSVAMTGNRGVKVNESLLSEDDNQNETSRNKSDEEMIGSSAASYETGGGHEELLTTEIRTGDANSPSELNTVRNIGARQLNFKYIFMVVVMVIPALAAFVYKRRGASLS